MLKMDCLPTWGSKESLMEWWQMPPGFVQVDSVQKKAL